MTYFQVRNQDINFPLTVFVEADSKADAEAKAARYIEGQVETIRGRQLISNSRWFALPISIIK